MLGLLMAIVAAIAGYIGMKGSASRKYRNPITIYFLSIFLSIFSFLLVGIPSISEDYLWGSVFLFVLLMYCGLSVKEQTKNNFSDGEKKGNKLKEEKLSKEINLIKKLGSKNHQVNYSHEDGFSNNQISKSKSKSRKRKVDTEKILKYRQVAFGYIDANNNYTYREVDVIDMDSEYLKGYCYSAGEFRTFRVDRIQDDVVCRETGEIL